MRLCALFALVSLLALAACSPQTTASQDGKQQTGTVPELDGAFGFDSLVIVNDLGEELTFDIYVATDDDQRRRGLMFVRAMPERTGMLFVYDSNDYRSMWMKNTYIPLDMVFARSDGSVSSVIRKTVPHTLTSNASVEPVSYVLELNGGVARKLGIGTRSRLVLNAGDD